MKIIADAFGGDNAPDEIIRGCREAADELGVSMILTGDTQKIKKASEKISVDISDMEIIDAPDVMTMEDDPREILRAKKNSSMAAGLAALHEGAGDAFVSAGSTGALVVGSTFIVKRIKGVRRVAIGAVMPAQNSPFMLIDAGATFDCKPETLVLFGIMGNIFMNKVLGIEKPRIALANNGSEATKGTPLYKEAYDLMSNAPFNFTGNIEGRRIPYGDADVIVCDGFTGNLILKTYEGVAKMLTTEMKDMFMKNAFTKMSALGVASGLKDLKTRMDYKTYGGAPILGVSKPVVKAHGSSDAKSFKNSIKQAKLCVDGKVPQLIGEYVPPKEDEKDDA